jgi:hypothetical protein
MMGTGVQCHAPATLPLGKTRYRLGRPQGQPGRGWKMSPPPGFDPRIAQPAASRYHGAHFHDVPIRNVCLANDVNVQIRYVDLTTITT